MTVLVAGARRDFSVDPAGRTHAAMGWRTETVDFTAVSTQTRLEIISETTNPPLSGPVIDRVTVVAR